MSAALHSLLSGSGEDSATETEKVHDPTDGKEHLSLESGENSKEMAGDDANCPHDEYSVSAEASGGCNTDTESNDDGADEYSVNTEDSDECNTYSKGNKDGTALAKPLAEKYEAKERSVLDLLHSPERDASLTDRSLIHTSIPTKLQSTSDEGASANFISWCKNIPPEEAVDILSHEGVTSHTLANSSKAQGELVTDKHSLAEEIEVASDSAEMATENTHNTSLQEYIYPECHVNHEAKSHSLQRRADSSPQFDTANVLPRKEEDEFLSQEQSSQENNLVQTLEDNSSRSDSDEDASSDFFPWSSPEREDEVINQGQTTTEGSGSDNQLSSPKSKKASFLNSSDTTNQSWSFSGAEEDTKLNSGQKLKCPGTQVNSEESERVEGDSLPDTNGNHGQQHGTWGHRIEYSLTSAELAIGTSSSYDLPWYKYLIGRECREALGHTYYDLQKNLAAPPQDA